MPNGIADQWETPLNGGGTDAGAFSDASGNRLRRAGHATGARAVGRSPVDPRHAVRESEFRLRRDGRHADELSVCQFLKTSYSNSVRAGYSLDFSDIMNGTPRDAADDNYNSFRPVSGLHDALRITASSATSTSTTPPARSSSPSSGCGAG